MADGHENAWGHSVGGVQPEVLTVTVMPAAPMIPVAPVGLVLAAGAGVRMGLPKALVLDERGVPWVWLAASRLIDAGCSPVIAVLGARAAEAIDMLPAGVLPVVAADWGEGMSASLRAGLHRCESTDAEAAVITLVDLPGLPAAAHRRLIGGRIDAATLRQAVYSGRPGHPVVIGRSHWADVVETLSGEEGARRYLDSHGAELVECSDLWDGSDVDSLS